MAKLTTNIRLTEGEGPNPSVILKRLEQRFSSENTERDLLKIKNEVLKDVRNFIDENKTRNSEEHDAKETWRTTAVNNLINTLEDKRSTKIESLGKDKWGLGIGNKRFLSKHAPYWFVLNYGRKYTGEIYAPPRTTGYFGSGGRPGGFANEVFHHTKGWKGKNPRTGGNSYLMQPMSPITPMHYLEEMSITFQYGMYWLEQQYRKAIVEAKNASREKIVKTPVNKSVSETEMSLESVYMDMIGKRRL